MRVGDFVLAIGYPANIGHSVTSGIVSGLHRSGSVSYLPATARALTVPPPRVRVPGSRRSPITGSQEWQPV